jgi:hypothetical protein
MIRDVAVYLLNRLVLQPAGWAPLDVGYDLDSDDWINDVPTGAGVYVLYTPRHFYTLPGGSSSVLYIGKGTSREGLRRRLREHQRFAREVRDGVYQRGYARYEWITAHPARAAYVEAPPPEVDAAETEHQMLIAFADAFRVAPLGNAQSAWARNEAGGVDGGAGPL